MEIHEGGYYVTRIGNVVGPIERTPKAEPGDVWVWRVRAQDGPTSFQHWTHEGKWFKDHGHESPNDIVQLVGDHPEALPERKLPPVTHDDGPLSPPPMTKHGLLDLAKAATADRGLNYGRPEDNFARIAAHWTVYLRNRLPSTAGPEYISPTDVAMMCALLKVARLEHQPNHQDSWVDLAGYAACGAEIALNTRGKV